ncbi:uncharacterized protein JN550_012335 [Neoarthrinium moseri]|uniref:uncharacterized protein n=1 Tax=Neoarthrinium moseri TaxID=1658444 RepID=UPI001FDDDDF5|nr:uncharacterized protein JN550_012335 [Neoarthrinium moseri]KAI1858876.1 hypothetical protein JN550_012335 [Neoarthrinium moseri]
MTANCSSDDSFGPAFSCPEPGTTFDFTLTFEHSILSIVPCAILLVILPVQLRKIWSWMPKTHPSKTLAGKAVISTILVGLHVALLVLWSRLNRSGVPLRTAIPYGVVSLVATVAVSALVLLEHGRSWRPSSLVSVYLGISALFDAVQVRTIFLRGPSTAIASVLSAALALKLALLGLQTRNKRSYLKEPYRRFPPETLSGILNRSFFWWLRSTFFQGYRVGLTLDSICDIDVELKSASMQSLILHAWTRHSDKGRFALASALASALRRPLLTVVLPRLCLVAFNYAQPFLIQRAVSLLEEPVNEQTANDRYGIIGATALVYLGIAHKLYRSLTMVRAATVSLIYVTSLESFPGTLDDAKTVTLMSTDVERTVSGLELLHETWARVLEIAIGIWLLARQIGAISIAPVIVAAACFTWQTWLARYMGPRQLPWIKSIQSRVANISSVLRNMKAVRMMGLANLVEEMLQMQRLRELHLSKPFRWMIVWVNMIASMPQVLAPLVIFAAYAIRSRVDNSGQLSVVTAFSSLAIISLITSPAVHLLSSIPALRAAEGCVDRIQKFLLSPKISRNDEHSSRKSSENGSKSSPYQHVMVKLGEGIKRDESGHLIKFEAVDLRPYKNAELLLKNASFGIPEAKLTMVIGPVGSGKSTFLKALVGEITPERGSLTIGTRSVAYCSQTPWLPNSSFRTVLCGPTEYEEAWYETVLEACDLKRDVQQFSHGDQTIIGSRGAILSGGQRQRLALARAIYARKSLLLLDDIFSALDRDTEENVIYRLFSDQGLVHKLQCTTVLVTHSMRHTSMADNVLVFDPETKTAKARAKSELISDILPPSPENSKDEQKEVNVTRVPQKYSSLTANNAVTGATQEDFEDLARRTGDMSVYLYYYRAIGLPRTLGACLILAVFTFTSNFPRFWLEWYTDDPVSRFSAFLGLYFMLVVVASSSQGAMIWQIMISIVPKSGAELHKILLRVVMRAPMQFFSSIDSGVTLNRFSQDMTLVDAVLPTVAFGTVLALMQCIAQLIFVCLGSSYMAICVPVAGITLYLIQKFYLRTSRQLRFLDLEAKSPLFTHFVETIEGLASIRAFHWQADFTEANLKHLDQSQKPYYLLFCIQRWLILVLDLMVAAMATVLMVLAFTVRATTSSGSLGVALTAVLSFSQSLQDLMLSWTQMETSLGAIARTKNLEDAIPPEDANDGKVQEPQTGWPSKGSIEFQHVCASYDGKDMALRDISLCVKPGQKVGILGRTGSGKSTLIAALLRLVDVVPPEHSTMGDARVGRILIDDTPITTVSRTALRSRILSIPQEGLTLGGTIRFNADPYHATVCRDSESGSIDDKSHDELILSAISRVGLWEAIEARGGLDGDMTSQPLSQGEGQLFAIARAIIRKDIASAPGPMDSGAAQDAPRRSGNTTAFSANDGIQRTQPTARHSILLLDEATSNLDVGTDAKIQTLIRNEFREFTIVTVAHRVSSIKSSDMVGVMEDGRLVRFGPPAEILREN